MSLNTIPTDTIQAEERRVWLPMERNNQCRTEVTIYDKSGAKVRTFFSGQLPRGYFNLYWDKRDDSGLWVPSGIYTYKIDDCVVKKNGKVTASYKEGETDLLLFSPQTEGILAVEFELYKDSLPVTLSILNQRGNRIQTIFSDSLMNSGRHHFDWTPGKRIARGYFLIQVKAGEAEHALFVHYMK